MVCNSGGAGGGQHGLWPETICSSLFTVAEDWGAGTVVCAEEYKYKFMDLIKREATNEEKEGWVWAETTFQIQFISLLDRKRDWKWIFGQLLVPFFLSIDPEELFFFNASVQSNIILHFLVVSSCSFHLISEAIHWKLKQSLAITLEGSYSGGEQLPQISGSWAQPQERRRKWLCG